MHLYVILSELSTSRYGQMHLYVIQSELSTSRYGLSAPLPGFGRACPHGSNLVIHLLSKNQIAMVEYGLKLTLRMNLRFW